MWKVTLTIDEYDFDFGVYFNGEAIEDDGGSVSVVADTPEGAVILLESQLTYAGSFFSALPDPRNPDRDTWAFWFKKNLLTVAKAIVESNSDAIDLEDIDGDAFGNMYAIDGGWDFTISGNRCYDLVIRNIITDAP